MPILNTCVLIMSILNTCFLPSFHKQHGMVAVTHMQHVRGGVSSRAGLKTTVGLLKLYVDSVL